jgi:hypothetical protein
MREEGYKVQGSGQLWLMVQGSWLMFVGWRDEK